jgi:O-Antigen ligase
LHQHAAVPIVATAYTAIAFAEGGFSPDLIAGAAIAIWWVVVVGLLARWWRTEKVSHDAVIVSALFVALGVWTLLSLTWAGDSGRAFVEVVRVAAYLGLFVLTVLALTVTSARRIFAGLAVGILIVAVTALVTRFFPALGGEDQELFASLPAAAGRLSFPVGYWNGLAACMALLIVLLAWFGATARTLRWRTIAVALIPIPVLTIFLASSRGGYGAATVGLLVLAVFVPERVRLLGGALIGLAGGAALALIANSSPDLIDGLETDSARNVGLVLALATVAVCAAAGGLRHRLESRLDALSLPRINPRAAVAVAAIAAVAAAATLDPVERLEEFVDAPTEVASGAGVELTRTGSSGRYQFWETGLDAFASDPVTGIGAGNYELYWNQHGSLPLVVNDAHSLFVETLAELGLVGAALLLATLIALVLAARRALGRGELRLAALVTALVATGLLSAALDWTWELPAAFVPLIVAAAALTQIRGPADAGAESEAEPAWRPDRFGLGIATVGVAWLSIWASGMLLLMEVKLDDSREAVASGDLDGAVQDAIDAGAIQPWSPEPALQEAQVELLRGDIEAARAAAAEALDRAPGDYRPWLVAARIEQEAGDERAYLEAFARAAELAPTALPGESAPPG